MLDVFPPFQYLLVVFAGWINREQLDVIDYLKEENRVLREKLGVQRWPIPGPGFRSTPNGLIPNRYPILSGSAPEPTIPSWPVLAHDANRSRKFVPLAHEWPENSPMINPGRACLTTHKPSSNFLVDEKERLKYLFVYCDTPPFC